MTMSDAPDRPPLFRAIAAGNDTTTLGLRSLGWTGPTVLIVFIVLSIGSFASTVTYAKRQATIGALVPAAGALRITPPRAGVVTALDVTEGQSVAAGDALVTLGFGQALAEGGTLEAALRRSLDSQEALLREQISAETGRAATERSRADAHAAGLAAEGRAVAAQRKLQDRRAGVAEDLARMAEDLRSRGLISEIDFRIREDAALAARQEMALLDQRLADLHSATSEARHRHAEIASEADDRTARLQSALSDVERQRAEVAADHAEVMRAPVAGRVTALQASVGQRADPARPLMTLVPEGSDLRADLFVPSRAIGFVQPGQPVRLMYDAFPFQHFGSYGGTVEAVSEAMLAPDDVVGPLRPDGPAYRVTVRLDRATIEAGDRTVALQPDMTLRADIILESRSLAEWLLQPLLAARGRM